MNVILMGPPAAGKGTQAAVLAGTRQLIHIASSELLHQQMLDHTEIDELARSYIDRGELLPDTVMTDVLLDRMHQPDCAAGVILDGFPRTLNQARLLTEALNQRQSRIDAVLSLTVPGSVLLQRITGRRICGTCETSYNIHEAPPQVADRCDQCSGPLTTRPDDTHETAQHRLEVYEEHTRPLLTYYRDQGILAEVDGQGSIDAVTARLLHGLEQVTHG